MTRVPGYLLSLGENTLDVHQFQQRMTSGRNHLLMGRLEQTDRGSWPAPCSS
ncbi:hypothetical protein ABZY57_18550 [Streptomyces sp. NPDC006450]|uniref:hypothetical protein n=1 Tax=Streptomyces sp. NPDC006450 TaxID=3155458 RepID=UPI0033AEE644